MRNFDPSTLRPSRHAREVMRERAVDWTTVLDIVRRPSLTEDHLGTTRYVRGDLTVVVGAGRGAAPWPTVVTVLWRKAEPWTSAQMRAR